jgi:hypothetical protein
MEAQPDDPKWGSYCCLAIGEVLDSHACKADSAKQTAASLTEIRLERCEIMSPRLSIDIRVVYGSAVAFFLIVACTGCVIVRRVRKRGRAVTDDDSEYESESEAEREERSVTKSVTGGSLEMNFHNLGKEVRADK